MKAPEVVVPEQIRQKLGRYGQRSVQEFGDWLRGVPRACISLKSRRVRQGGVFHRLFGSPEPALPVVRSKLGGSPYPAFPPLDKQSEFVCQINFADVPRLEGVPSCGMLRIDSSRKAALSGFVARWEPSPLAADLSPASRHARAEAEIVAELSWTLPEGKELNDALHNDDELIDTWFGSYPAGYTQDDEYAHRIGGWRSAGIEEGSGFEPIPGESRDVLDYEMFLRLSMDAEWKFFGHSGILYVLVLRGDLEKGRFDRLTCVVSPV